MCSASISECFQNCSHDSLDETSDFSERREEVVHHMKYLEVTDSGEQNTIKHNLMNPLHLSVIS